MAYNFQHWIHTPSDGVFPPERFAEAVFLAGFEAERQCSTTNLHHLAQCMGFGVEEYPLEHSGMLKQDTWGGSLVIDPKASHPRMVLSYLLVAVSRAPHQPCHIMPKPGRGQYCAQTAQLAIDLLIPPKALAYAQCLPHATTKTLATRFRVPEFLITLRL